MSPRAPERYGRVAGTGLATAVFDAQRRRSPTASHAHRSESTMMRRSSLTILLAAIVACGDSGTDAPPVDRVVVSPDETALGALGETATFTAEALDNAGAPLDGVDFDWESSDPTVATVDDDGTATATGAGDVFIRATTQGITGEGRLVVRECGSALTLDPGEFQTVDLTGQDECGFILPAGGAGDLYRVGVVRTGTNASTSDVQTVRVEVRALAPAEAPATASRAERPARPSGIRIDARALDGDRWSERTLRFHLELREREARMLDALGTLGVLRPRPATARVQAADAPDRLMIDPATPTLCTPAGTPTPAFKIVENDDLAIFQDSAQAGSKPITAAQAQRMLDYYSAHGKPIVDTYFGGVGDVDGNGKILLVAHPVVSGGVAAFVWSGDFFDKQDCPASNEAELIFFSADLIRAMDNGNHQALETVVHEAKHVSSLYKSVIRSQIRNQTSYHPGWVEEGSAEIAGNMSARRAWASVGGPPAHDEVDEQDIRDHGADDDGLLPEFYGIAIRFLRVQGYLSSQPNGLLANPLGSSSDHSIYGSGWAFMRWLGDAFGGAGNAPFADADFFEAQNDSLAAAGIPGLEALTGRTFQQLMIDYTLALMLNGVSTPGVAAPRPFTSYDFPSAVEVFCFAADNPPCDDQPAGPAGSFPWPVTAQSDGTMARSFVDGTYQGSAGPGGVRIHEFRSSGTAAAEVLVSAPSGARVIVARIR
jgi:hypothetical protein